MTTYNVIINIKEDETEQYFQIAAESAGAAEHELLDSFKHYVKTALAIDATSDVWKRDHSRAVLIGLREIVNGDRINSEYARAEKMVAALGTMKDTAFDMREDAAAAFSRIRTELGGLIIENADDPDGSTFKTARGLRHVADDAFKALDAARDPLEKALNAIANI